MSSSPSKMTSPAASKAASSGGASASSGGASAKKTPPPPVEAHPLSGELAAIARTLLHGPNGKSQFSGLMKTMKPRTPEEERLDYQVLHRLASIGIEALVQGSKSEQAILDGPSALQNNEEATGASEPVPLSKSVSESSSVDESGPEDDRKLEARSTPDSATHTESTDSVIESVESVAKKSDDGDSDIAVAADQPDSDQTGTEKLTEEEQAIINGLDKLDVNRVPADGEADGEAATENSKSDNVPPQDDASAKSESAPGSEAEITSTNNCVREETEGEMEDEAINMDDDDEAYDEEVAFGDSGHFNDTTASNGGRLLEQASGSNTNMETSASSDSSGNGRRGGGDESATAEESTMAGGSVASGAHGDNGGNHNESSTVEELAMEGDSVASGVPDISSDGPARNETINVVATPEKTKVVAGVMCWMPGAKKTQRERESYHLKGSETKTQSPYGPVDSSMGFPTLQLTKKKSPALSGNGKRLFAEIERVAEVEGIPPSTLLQRLNGHLHQHKNKRRRTNNGSATADNGSANDGSA